MTEHADQPAQTSDRRDRRVYVWWGVGFALLLALGLFCWLALGPYLEVRRALGQRPWDEAQAMLGPAERVVPRLGTYLRLPSWLAPNKAGAISLLITYGSRDGLAAALGSPDAEVRETAIDVLWGWRSLHSAVEKLDLVVLLADRLGDEAGRGRVRYRACRILYRTARKTDSIVPQLTAALADRNIQDEACALLGRAGPAGIPALRGVLEGPDADLRPVAVEALGSCGPEALPLLAPEFRSNDREARNAAAAALHKLGLPAVAMLLSELEGADQGLRQRAVEVLSDMEVEHDAPARPPQIFSDDHSYWSAAWAASSVRQARLDAKRTVPVMLGLLKQPNDTMTRLFAVLALRDAGPQAKEAIPVLEELVRKEKAESALHYAAAEALKKIRTDARVFRVLTLNVQKGTPAARIAADLAAAGADILCLQELDQGTKRSGEEDQPALLKKALGLNGAYVPSYRDDGGTTGMAILSRFPVEDAAPIKLAGSRDIGIRAAVKLPGGTVTVFSVHLSATYKLDMAHLAETREMRRRETARLIELVGQTKGPVILAGDLNCTLDPDLVTKLAGHLTDATAGVQATYPAKTPAIKIDYVFARGLEVVRSQAMPEGSSDHRAVLCELRLPE